MDPLGDELAMAESIALAIREEPELKQLRAYLEECSVWALRCYLAQVESPVLRLYDALVLQPPLPFQAAFGTAGHDLKSFKAALLEIRKVAAEWLEGGNGKFGISARHIQPDTPLYRRSFFALDGAITFYLGAIESRAQAARSREAQTWQRIRRWFTGLSPFALFGLALAAAAVVALVVWYANRDQPPVSPQPINKLPTNAKLQPLEIQRAPQPMPGALAILKSAPAIFPPRPTLFAEVTPSNSGTKFLAVYKILRSYMVRRDSEMGSVMELGGGREIAGRQSCGSLQDALILAAKEVEIEELANRLRQEWDVTKVQVLEVGKDFDPTGIGSCADAYPKLSATDELLYEVRPYPPATSPLTYDLYASPDQLRPLIPALNDIPTMKVCAARYQFDELARLPMANKGRSSIPNVVLTIRVTAYSLQILKAVGAALNVDRPVVIADDGRKILHPRVQPLLPSKVKDVSACVTASDFFAPQGPGTRVLERSRGTVVAEPTDDTGRGTFITGIDDDPAQVTRLRTYILYSDPGAGIDRTVELASVTPGAAGQTLVSIRAREGPGAQFPQSLPSMEPGMNVRVDEVHQNGNQTWLRVELWGTTRPSPTQSAGENWCVGAGSIFRCSLPPEARDLSRFFRQQR